MTTTQISIMIFTSLLQLNKYTDKQTLFKTIRENEVETLITDDILSTVLDILTFNNQVECKKGYYKFLEN